MRWFVDRIGKESCCLHSKLRPTNAMAFILEKRLSHNPRIQKQCYEIHLHLEMYSFAPMKGQYHKFALIKTQMERIRGQIEGENK